MDRWARRLLQAAAYFQAERTIRADFFRMQNRTAYRRLQIGGAILRAKQYQQPTRYNPLEVLFMLSSLTNSYSERRLVVEPRVA